MALRAIEVEADMSSQTVDYYAEAAEESETLAVGELLIEEVSIDGMCGVY
jgi:mycofactocin precursor